MKTKYGKWSTVSRFFQTLGFKSALVVVVSLFATIKLTSQNQNPPSPPVIEATPAGAVQEQATQPTNESFQFVMLPNGAMTMQRLATQPTNATATPGSPAAPSPAETQPATAAPASLQTTPAPAASDEYHWDPFERHTKAVPAPAPSPVPAPTASPAPAPAPSPVTSAQQPAVPADDALVMPPPLLQAPKPTKNEVSVSGDMMLGQGTVTLPLGYSLKQSLGGIVPTPVSAFSVPRSSTYYGGTVSYSYGQAWYVDLSFAQGQSSGSQSIDTGFLGSLNSTFSINDTWYQIYVKYTFPQLRGKRFSAYLRAGASYINSELKDNSTDPIRYTQTDTTQDLLGNLGAGLGYTVYSSRHLRFGLQTEIEGFYGFRSQSSLETLGSDNGLTPTSASINNTLYGGIGRATMRLEYRLGQSGLFKIFGELGAEGRYTMISYPSAGTQNELLWGPYAKLGIRYSF